MQQIIHKKSLLLSLVLAVFALTGIRVFSSLAAVALLVEASVLLGLLFQRTLKSSDTILSSVLGGFAILIITGAFLGSIGILTYPIILLGLTVSIVLLSFIPFEFPKIRLQKSLVWIGFVSLAGFFLAVALRHFSPYPIQIDTDVTKEAIRINYIGIRGAAPLILAGDLRPLIYDTMISIISILSGFQLLILSGMPFSSRSRFTVLEFCY